MKAAQLSEREDKQMKYCFGISPPTDLQYVNQMCMQNIIIIIIKGTYDIRLSSSSSCLQTSRVE